MKPLVAMIMIATRPPETVTGRSEKLSNFLRKCLKKNPEERETVDELLQDPFVADIGDGTTEKDKFKKLLDKIVKG